MARPYNWQLGRDAEYPYDAPPPKRQVAYIFDTNKCIDCQTCTVACKTAWTSGKGQEHIFWNNVETKPYGGYPLGWDKRLLETRPKQRWQGHIFTDKTIFEDQPPGEGPTGWRPEAVDYSAPNVGEDDIAGQLDKGAYITGVHPMWMFYMARICNHCTLPACVAACPRKAVYKREEDGIVLVDQERCRGYQECVKACPYKKVFYNLVSRASEKCIGCYPRVEQGQVALCVESCIGKIRMHGFLSTQSAPREDNPLDYIIRIRKLALPSFPQFGTQPNVYYIPPIHVPNTFLEQMFGPSVQAAKDLYRSVKDDRQLLGALLLFGASDRIIERFAVEGDHALGWDGDGTEVARVPFTEYTWVRDHHDRRHGAYRHNTT